MLFELCSSLDWVSRGYREREDGLRADFFRAGQACALLQLLEQHVQPLVLLLEHLDQVVRRGLVGFGVEGHQTGCGSSFGEESLRALGQARSHGLELVDVEEAEEHFVQVAHEDVLEVAHALQRGLEVSGAGGVEVVRLDELPALDRDAPEHELGREASFLRGELFVDFEAPVEEGRDVLALAVLGVDLVEQLGFGQVEALPDDEVRKSLARVLHHFEAHRGRLALAALRLLQRLLVEGLVYLGHGVVLLHDRDLYLDVLREDAAFLFALRSRELPRDHGLGSDSSRHVADGVSVVVRVARVLVGRHDVVACRVEAFSGYFGDRFIFRRVSREVVDLLLDCEAGLLRVVVDQPVGEVCVVSGLGEVERALLDGELRRDYGVRGYLRLVPREVRSRLLLLRTAAAEQVSPRVDVRRDDRYRLEVLAQEVVRLLDRTAHFGELEVREHVGFDLRHVGEVDDQRRHGGFGGGSCDCCVGVLGRLEEPVPRVALLGLAEEYLELRVVGVEAGVRQRVQLLEELEEVRFLAGRDQEENLQAARLERFQDERLAVHAHEGVQVEGFFAGVSLVVVLQTELYAPRMLELDGDAERRVQREVHPVELCPAADEHREDADRPLEVAIEDVHQPVERRVVLPVQQVDVYVALVRPRVL